MLRKFLAGNIFQSRVVKTFSPSSFSHVRFISNYYRFFPKTLPQGPPPKGPFSIDLDKLRSEYIAAQRLSHPDVAGSNNQISSAELGTAYRTLQNPVTRAEHILALQDANPLNEGAASLEDEDLLLEIMMIREHVSEAESADELNIINNENDKKWETTMNTLSTALESGDIPQAQTKLVELTYLNKIREAISEKLDELKKSKSA